MANNIQGYDKIVKIETDCFEDELERVRTFFEDDSLWELCVNYLLSIIFCKANLYHSYDEHDGAEVCMSDYQNSNVKVLRFLIHHYSVSPSCSSSIF